MIRSVGYILTLCIYFAIGGLEIYAEEKSDIFIIPEFNKDSYYCNEAGKVTIWLYSSNPNINGISEISPVSIGNGSFSYLTRISENHQVKTKKIKGKEYYIFPIATYAFMVKESGKYNISAGDYNVRVGVPTIIQSPIYGRVKALKESILPVSGSSQKIKIQNLPENKKSQLFSGAIGQYTVEIVIPPGEIIINEPATVIIRVSGNGFIGDDTLPDYRKAFTQNIKVKSVNEKNDYYYDGNNIISQKVLECEVIPTQIEDCVIDSVEFGYFNPETKRFEIAGSEPVRLDVKSSIVKITPFDI